MRFNGNDNSSNGSSHFPSYRMESHGDLEHDQENGSQTGNKPVKNTFREFTEQSSLQGLKQVTSPEFHLFRRVLWCSALLIGLIVLLYTLVIQITRFLQYKVEISITHVDQPRLVFPAVTLCNHNQFRRSVASQSPEMSHRLHTLFSVESRLEDERADLHAESLTSQDYNVTQELISMAHTMEDMFQSCKWQGQGIHCHQYMSMTMTELGVCYTFHSQEVQDRMGHLEVHEGGTDHGLTMRINIEDAEYYYGEGTASGMQVLLHHPLEVPLVRQIGFSVSPGTATMVAMTLRHEMRTPAPYGDCEDSHDPSFRNPLQHYDVYSRAGCKLEHRTDYVFDKCNCRQFYDPGNGTVCKEIGDIECYREARDQHAQEAALYLNHECPYTCSFHKYSYKLSYAHFPASHILEQLHEANNNVTEKHIRDNLLELKIYFEDMSVHLIEHLPAYTRTDLFASIGGQMGLCLGASLLTIVETMEVFGLACIRSAKK